MLPSLVGAYAGWKAGEKIPASGIWVFIAIFAIVLVVIKIYTSSVHVYEQANSYFSMDGELGKAYREYHGWFSKNDFDGEADKLKYVVDTFKKVCDGKEFALKDKHLSCDLLSEIYGRNLTYYEDGDLKGMEQDLDMSNKYIAKKERVAYDMCKSGDLEMCETLLRGVKKENEKLLSKSYDVLFEHKEKECFDKNNFEECLYVANVYYYGEVKYVFDPGLFYDKTYTFTKPQNTDAAYKIYDGFCKKDSKKYVEACNLRDTRFITEKSKLNK